MMRTIVFSILLLLSLSSAVLTEKQSITATEEVVSRTDVEPNTMSVLAQSLSGPSEQTEHVKFLGIPLDGTIRQFHESLTANGFRFDQKTNDLLPKGMRAFLGTYAERDAMVIVLYDEVADVVYQAKAIITCQGVINSDSVFNEINGQLQSEYGTLLSTKSIQYGHEAYGYTILSKERVVVGDIGLFVTKDENYPDVFLVQVQYTDTANLRIHERQQSGDS